MSLWQAYLEDIGFNFRKKVLPRRRFSKFRTRLFSTSLVRTPTALPSSSSTLRETWSHAARPS
jgi:hypothetical protein